MSGQNDTLEETAAIMDGIISEDAPSNRYGFSLISILTQLAYHKTLLATVTGMAFFAGIIFSLLLPVRYTATTKLMPPQQIPSSASMLMNQLANGGAGSLAAIAGGGLSLKNPNDIFIGLLTSRPIAEAIIQKFDLAKVYHAKDMTQARKKLAGYTEVTSAKGGFITVSVTDEDKERVAKMANAYTDQLRILTKTLAVTEASQRRLFYEEQLKQARETLIAAELAFQQVQQQKGLVQLDAQAKAMIEGIAALRAQVASKQVELHARRSYSTEQNPDVQLAEKELASLQDEEARLEQINHSPRFGGIGLGNVPAAGLEYLRAAHELAYRQALSDILMKQYDAARLDEAKEATIIQVVEPAIVPERKTSPNRTLIVLLFTLAGFFGGSLSVATLRWWRDIVQSDPILAKQFEELNYALKARK